MQLTFTHLHIFLSLSILLSSLTPKTQIVDCFLKPFGVNKRGSKGDFHGDKSCASTHTRLAKVVGRFTHEPGSVGGGLELRFSTQNFVFGGSGLHHFGALGSDFLA